MKKIIKKFLILLLVIIPFLCLAPVKADSGWDSDYDSGGSWDSGGSDWGSSNDWDYSSSSSSSSSSGEGSIFSLIFFLIVFTVVIVYISKTPKNLSINNKGSNGPIYNDISEEQIKKFLPDEDLGYLKNIAFKKFVDIQNAWSDFEYDKLRELCTDELYNSYITQLDTLKLKFGKNVMKDFEQHVIKITGITEEAGNIIVKVYLKVSFYDYVINTNTNQVTRGTDQRKITNNYIMTFVKAKGKTEGKCPNCGAPIKGNTSSKCEYCDSTLITDSKDFVLSKKTNVNI